MVTRCTSHRLCTIHRDGLSLTIVPKFEPAERFRGWDCIGRQSTATIGLKINSSQKGLRMRRSRLYLVLILFTLLAGCKDLGQPSSDDMIDYRGTVSQQSPETFFIESDIAFENHFKTFYPLNLGDTFKRDGLRIRFSGKIEIDPTCECIVPPIRLSRVELLER